MGLKGDIENIYGVDFNYHRIVDIHIIINDNDKQLRITTESYKDKDARIAGKAAVKTVNIIENADFAMNAFYSLLKAKFKDFGSIHDDFDDQWKKTSSKEQTFTQQTIQGQLISTRKEGK